MPIKVSLMAVNTDKGVVNGSTLIETRHPVELTEDTQMSVTELDPLTTNLSPQAKSLKDSADRLESFSTKLAEFCCPIVDTSNDRKIVTNFLFQDEAELQSDSKEGNMFQDESKHELRVVERSQGTASTRHCKQYRGND